jgi:hypothetical protein
VKKVWTKLDFQKLIVTEKRRRKKSEKVVPVKKTKQNQCKRKTLQPRNI